MHAARCPSKDIGPLEPRLRQGRTGPLRGASRADRARGDWQLDVAARVSDFERVPHGAGGAGGVTDRRALRFAALTLVWLLGLELLGVEAAFAYLAPGAADPAAAAGRALSRATRAPARAAAARRTARPAPPARGPRPPAARRRSPAPAAAGWSGAALAGRRPSAREPAHALRARYEEKQDARERSSGDRRAQRRLALALAGTGRGAHHGEPGGGPVGRLRDAATSRCRTAARVADHPGCAIQVPPSVPSVTRRSHPLWDVATKEGKKDKVELHGETITRGVSEVDLHRQAAAAARPARRAADQREAAGRQGGRERLLPDRPELREGRDALDPDPGRGREPRGAGGARRRRWC